MILYQPDTGYCYNSDSVFLSYFIDSFKPKGKLLDVGAGCGIVGLLVAKHNPKVMLEAVEKQKYFMEYAEHNARVNKLEYKLHKGDFLELNFDEKYDYVVSNPPFYSDGAKRSDNEMLFNARYNVHLPLNDFFKKVSQILKPQSHFIFCYDASQFGLICVALEKVKMRVVDVQFIHSKVDKPASLVMIHARNGSRALMKVLEPLIIYEADKFTVKAQEVYKKLVAQSIKCQL